MQISNKLNSFNTPTLLLVTSRQNAKAYLATNRTVQELFTLHQDTPTFSDNEGHFERSGNGLQFGSGSTEIDIDEITLRETMKLLNEKLDKIDENYSEVILFVPEQLKNLLTNKLPESIQAKITKTITGNLIQESPMQLIERLQ